MRKFNWPLAAYFLGIATVILAASFVAVTATGLLTRIAMLICALVNCAILASMLTRMRYTFRRYPMWREIIDNVNEQMDKSGVHGGKVEIMLRVTGNDQGEAGSGDAGTWVN